MKDPVIYVSSNVLAFRDGKVLMGLRDNSAGAGEWGFVGGHVEKGENLVDCAKREFMEETGLEIDNLRYLGVINKPSEDRHYIHFVYYADCNFGEPKLMEPNQCKEWQWFALDALPENIFFAHTKFLSLLDSESKIIEEL